MEKAIGIILALGVVGIAHGMIFPGVVTMTSDRKPPTRCVAPSRLECSMIDTRPAQSGGTQFVFGKVSYDAIGKRIRVFQTVVGARPQQAYDVRFFFKLGYRYDVDVVKQRCYKFSIPKTFPTYQVPKSATFAGSFYYGLSFWINQWADKFDPAATLYMAWTADGKCLPVSQTVVTTNAPLITRSFFNMTLGIRDQSVFNLPKICRKAVLQKPSENSWMGGLFAGMI